MDFILKLFAKKNSKEKNIEVLVEQSQECIQIQELGKRMQSFLGSERYAARSEFFGLTSEYKEVADYFMVLSKSGMLRTFCAQNRLSEKEILD